MQLTGTPARYWRPCRQCTAALLFLAGANAGAAVLPEERADLLYHSYDGGGVEVTGPSLLVRKNVGQSWSVFGNYYVDSVSSASVDVIATASAYKDERTETSFGVDYLRGSTILTLSNTGSDESDYTANSLSFGISQDMFGDLTTVTLGYTSGDDTVGNATDPAFSEDVNRKQYRLGLSQILTKSLIVSAALETITDEGFLNNPYRSVRYVDAGSPTGYSFEPEAYPRTRTSDAFALRARYFLAYRAALFGEYRQYRDTWGIDADTFEIGYVHPFREVWTFEVRLRQYDQTAADFYSDLFPFQNAQNFLARDKELSTFNSRTFGVSVSYELAKRGWGFVDRASFNFSFDRIQFSYDDFRDITQPGFSAGSEPLYEFDADVLQLYLSIWY